MNTDFQDTKYKELTEEIIAIMSISYEYQNGTIVFYTYVLLSEKDNNFYVGFTKDLKKRIDEHNKGIVPSTVYRRPFKLFYFFC